MPKSASPKKAGAPKAKGAVRAKSGCYTCRIRRKKCDEQPDDHGRCQTCVRLRLQCLGFGAKRPEWLRENNNVQELREKIKTFLASQGMIKGHSGSGSRAPEQDQTLQLSEYNHTHTPSESPSSATLQLDEDMTPHGHVSNLREQQTDLYSPATYGAGPSSYDTPIYSHSSQLYISSSPYGGPQQELGDYHESYTPFLMSNATNTVVPSGIPIQSSSFGSLYHAQLDYDSPQYENFPWQGLMPDMSDPLLQHYMESVYRMQYQLADMEKLPRILFKHLKNSGMARDAAVLLSAIHKEGGQRVLSREGPTRTRYDELLQLFRLSEGAYNEDHAMAALHIISAFLFDGGRGEWEDWMRVASLYVYSILENDVRFLSRRDALLHCHEEQNFIIKTVFWFDVIAAVTTMRPPQFRDVINEIYNPNQSGIDDPQSDFSEKLSMMKIMGCENRILWALSEISALADWKQRQDKDGKRSVLELVRRANVLEESLAAPSQQTFSQFDNVEEDARYYASEIFRTAAIVYLRTVVNDDHWRVSDIETAVKDCVSAFKSFMQHRNDVRHAVVRSTVFAVFLCGCLTNVENDWEVLQNFSSEVGTVGNCMHALELMKKVRAGRMKAQPVQWRKALNKEQLLLV
ncbi:hypothetical protein VKT23_006797 [Stygiomarasmius scandens]|uniref:Zn(2)-C6 fungal-type domain-containing protein n=1 Tax=Marasmiellus scandens TaxID=2682957 RepID=A0ABR1JKU7_9AGAR